MIHTFYEIFWNLTYDWFAKTKLFILILYSLDPVPFFLGSSLGIPYMVLWLNVWNKELLTLRDFLVVTKKFLKAKFDCRYYLNNLSFTWLPFETKGIKVNLVSLLSNSKILKLATLDRKQWNSNSLVSLVISPAIEIGGMIFLTKPNFFLN